MEKFTINGIEFNNFGSNNYSDGMELISCTNPPKDLIQRVLDNEFHGIYLNPSAPCSDFEFFGLFGTKEQYQKAYKNQKEAKIAKAMCEKFGYSNWNVDPLVPARYERDLRDNYKDWWEK